MIKWRESIGSLHDESATLSFLHRVTRYLILAMSQTRLSLLFVLTLCAYIGMSAEKSRDLSKVSGVLITMFSAALLSKLGLIPPSASVYDMAWQYFIPLSIPFILMRARLKTNMDESGPTLIAFIIGGLGTLLGSVLAFFLISLGSETGKIISMFCSSYIGGSINYVAVSKTFALQNPHLFLAGNAADDVVMAMYSAVLGLISYSPFLKKKFKARAPELIYQKENPIPLGSGVIEVKSLILP